MLNTQVIYYQTDDGGTFYFRQKDLTLINDLERASRWSTKKEAQKVLRSLDKKALPNQTILALPKLKVGCVDLIEDFELTQTMLSISEPTPEDELLNELLLMDQADFLALIDDISHVIMVLPELRNVLKNDVKYADSVILQDYLHTIELSDFDLKTGYHLAQKLKQSRQKWRCEKDRLQLISALVSAEDEVTITVERAKKTQRLLHSIQGERHYHYRSKDIENELGDMLSGS